MATIVDPAWLEWLAMTSRPSIPAGVWLTGFVLALRRRPAGGASLAAVGFGLLGSSQLLSLVFALIVGREPDRFWSAYFEVGRFEVFLEPWMVFATADAVIGLAEAAGAMCLILGGTWRVAENAGR